MTVILNRTIGAIPVDIIIDEEHTSSLDITKLPIENGANATDHAIVQPFEISVRGIVKNVFGGWQSLTSYQRTRVPFTLITGISVYPNMLIEKISTPRNKENADILFFIATMKQIIIVGSSFAASEVNAVPNGQAARIASENLEPGETRLRASPTIKRGDNVVKPVNTDPTTRDGRRMAALVERIS